MNSAEYLALPLSKKKKIIKSVIQAVNKEQRELMDRYHKMKLSRKT